MSQIKTTIREIDIAPCGMNCALCVAFTRDKNPCPGCNIESDNKPKHCTHCSVVICELRSLTESGFCYDCEKYPCRRIKDLDKRYRAKYGMSMKENLEYIRDHGMEAFVDWENSQWTCIECGSIVSVHRNECLSCGRITDKRYQPIPKS